MAKKFSKLKANLPTEVQERINTKAKAEVKRLLAEIPSHKLSNRQVKTN